MGDWHRRAGVQKDPGREKTIGCGEGGSQGEKALSKRKKVAKEAKESQSRIGRRQQGEQEKKNT